MFSEQDKRRDATCWVIAEDVEYTKRYQDTHIWLECMGVKECKNKEYAPF